MQALIDIGARILSGMGVKPPGIYGEIARSLKDEGFLTDDESELVAKIIGFRNIFRSEKNSSF